MKTTPIKSAITSALLFASCVSQGETIYSSFNADATLSNPPLSPVFEITTPTRIARITNYHWNGGSGRIAEQINGSIGLRQVVDGVDGDLIGPWPAVTRHSGYGPPAFWDAEPNIVLAPGRYKVIDSNHATWSYTTTDVFGYLGGNGANWEPGMGFSEVIAGQPEISVKHGDSEVANGDTHSFAAVVGTTADLTFTIFNAGTSNLNLNGNPKVTVTGSPDFTVIAQPESPIAGPGGSSGFTVRFTPTGSGLKTASLSIPNNDDDEHPFVIHLSGNALSFAADTDGDGINDAAEFNMAALGFDWQASQPALVDTFNNGANDAGFYSAAQVQALHVGKPLLQRDALTGEFTLTIGVKKSVDLLEFDPFPFTAPGITINGAGELEFRFASSDNAAFFLLGVD